MRASPGCLWGKDSSLKFKAPPYAELFYFIGESLRLSALALPLALSGEEADELFCAEFFLELRSGDTLSGSREALLSCILRFLIS